MSYSVSCDAFTQLISVTHGGAALTGPIGITCDKSVDWKIVRGGGATVPSCLALDMVGAEIRVRFHGADSYRAHTVDPSNIVATFENGDGDSGTITIGECKAGAVNTVFDEGQNAMVAEQVFTVQGTLTFTISM